MFHVKHEVLDDGADAPSPHSLGTPPSRIAWPKSAHETGRAPSDRVSPPFARISSRSTHRARRPSSQPAALGAPSEARSLGRAGRRRPRSGLATERPFRTPRPAELARCCLRGSALKPGYARRASLQPWHSFWPASDVNTILAALPAGRAQECEKLTSSASRIRKAESARRPPPST